MDYFTNAEILFGFHVSFDWSTFWRTLVEGIFGLLPGVSQIQTGVELYQAMFHSGSIVGVASNMAAGYVQDYVSEPLNDFIEEKLGDKAHKAIGWAWNLISVLKDATINSFIIPNANDMVIYDKIESQDNFLVIFEDKNVTMKEIMEQCSHTNNG